MQPRQSFIREVADIRRLSLIAACARCLAARGAQGVSVRAICKEAGVSAGLLRHYFSGVDALIAETYRTTGDRVEHALADAVANAPPTPRARLLAYVTASFRAPIADADLLATWLAFWGLVKTDPAIAAIHDDIYSNYRTGIETLIDAQSVTPRNNRLTAVALTALVDGLWLELSLGSAPFTPEEASVLAERWLDTLLT